jgi:hypothetical protein
MYHFIKFYKNLPFSIFISSFIVFILLNIIENYIHYNIGRNYNQTELKLSSPYLIDWIKIIITMIIFAILQGIFTIILYNYMH